MKKKKQIKFTPWIKVLTEKCTVLKMFFCFVLTWKKRRFQQDKTFRLQNPRMLVNWSEHYDSCN